MAVQCKIRGCNATEADWLGDHLQEVHGLSVDEYTAQHPTAAVASQRLLDGFEALPAPRRTHPPAPSALKVNFGGLEFQVNAGVEPLACLPEPANYRVPRHGDLSKDVHHALISLARCRSLYIWGLPGSGKDALIHAWSARTRTPAIIEQVIPGSDIEAWFFSRSFNEHGTMWEEGALLKALRDGYLMPDGRRIPYLFLCSDIDRADRAQAEYLRLITDSIQGRISGPTGRVYEVMPGTRIVATANTAGSGDARGRCISANPLDASILDRFARKFEFHWMDWRDEEPILKAKFPLLMERCPAIFTTMGRVTKALREAILDESLYAEFSHRGLCAILEHAEDLLTFSTQKRVPATLLKRAARAWLDGLPDVDTRAKAVALMDPFISGGMVDPGNTSHIDDDPLADI